MKNILSVALACVMIFGFCYNFMYKNNDGKLHCKLCDGTYFIPSERYAKFITLKDERIRKVASFYHCSKCGVPTDIVVN